MCQVSVSDDDVSRLKHPLFPNFNVLTLNDTDVSYHRLLRRHNELPTHSKRELGIGCSIVEQRSRLLRGFVMVVVVGSSKAKATASTDAEC